jgi:hypothetical protein
MSSDDVQVEAALALYGASITRHDLAAVLEWDLARGLIGPFGCSRSGWLGLDSTCGARAGTESPRVHRRLGCLSRAGSLGSSLRW